MPRTISLPMLDHLQGNVITLALCLLLQRPDGVTVGVTSHDEPLQVLGQDYLPSAGASATAIKYEIGAGVDNLEVEGATSQGLLLLSGALTEEDLRTGRWDAASVTIYLCNWQDTATLPITLFRGNLGDINLTDGAYKTEARSLTQKLNQQVGNVLSATCRVKDFGDSECNPPGGIGAYQAVGIVGVVTNRRVFTVGGIGGFADATRYSQGKIEFLTGQNAGFVREIKVGNNFALELHEPLPFNPAPGDSVRLTRGCDRRLATCKAKFANQLNFRGEPHVPGNDLLTERGRGI
jgi:uncharacterized phage protein (TIGR02218 family)